MNPKIFESWKETYEKGCVFLEALRETPIIDRSIWGVQGVSIYFEGDLRKYLTSLKRFLDETEARLP